MRRFIGRLTHFIGAGCFLIGFFGMFLIPGMIEADYEHLWNYVAVIMISLIVAAITSNTKE